MIDMGENIGKRSVLYLAIIIIALVSVGGILEYSLRDPDGDGLRNYEELIQGASPTDPNSDGDGIRDNTEVEKYGTNPSEKDTDGDGLDDDEEIEKYGTDPLDPDTDNDYIEDPYDPDPLTYGYYLRFVQDEPSRIWEVRLIDMDEAERMEGEVDKLTEEMKSDARSCISSTKSKTFQNLAELVHRRVPHTSDNAEEYPNVKWENQFDDWGSHPRDPLYQYYQEHDEVDLPPDCDDLSAVYDVMADYIIDYENWENSVKSDMFRFSWDNVAHIACIVNIEGTEYIADPTPGDFISMTDASSYTLTGFMGKMLMGKFDKRYLDAKIDSGIGFRLEEEFEDNMMDLLRSLDSDEVLRELYLKGLSISESSLYQNAKLMIDENDRWRFKM